MKNTLKLLAIVLAVLMFNWQIVSAQQDTGTDQDDQLVLPPPGPENQGPPPEGGFGPPPGRMRDRWGRGPGFGRGWDRDADFQGPMGPGRGAGPRGEWRGGPDGGPGRGQGPDGGPGGGRFGGGRIEPAEMINFLNEHEPDLAAKLEQLRQQDPVQYRRQMYSVMGLYGPVMREMQWDPEMAKFSLDRIHLRLQIEQDVKDVKTAKEDATRQAKDKLKGNVSKLFDTIVTQEEARLTRWEQRLTEENTADQPSQQGYRGRGRRPRPMMGQGRGAPGRHEKVRERIEDREQLIKTWREQKDLVVQTRMNELLQDIKPFPWD